MKITPEQIRQIFDNPLPPETIWEQQFDGCQKNLENLVRKDWEEITIEELCTVYFLDLQWLEDLQPDLFRYLFPACLKCWYRGLMQNKNVYVLYPDLLEVLYYANIIERMVTPTEREAIYNFFHDAFIERIEAERGFIYTGSSTPAYNWIYTFSRLGCIVPINRIWLTWWSLDSPGKAVSAMMYASGFIYLKGDNPIFQPWTPKQGGGGPYIIGSHLPWLEENLLFLQKTLSVKYIQEKFQAAADILREQPEANLAARIAKDALEKEDIISIRIDDLIAGLEGWEVSDD